MLRTTLNKTTKNNGLNNRPKTSQAHLSEASIILGLSFLMSLIALGMGSWRRGQTASLIQNHADIGQPVYPESPEGSFSLYGEREHLVSSNDLIASLALGVFAYQLSGHPLVGLLSSWPLWLGRPVSAQSLPALIDFNIPLSLSKGLVLQGGAVDDYAGFSVSSAGDVNGDGLADVLVGAYQASPPGRTYAGAAYIIYGSRSLAGVINLGSVNATQGVVLQGVAVDDYAGRSVSSAGDVNGDGLADVLVGAYNTSPAGRAQAGVAYIIYGSRSLAGVINLGSVNATQGVVLQGGAASDGAGTSVSSAGDVNGDGLADVLVGARGASPASKTRAGAAYIIYGSRSLAGVIDLGSVNATQGVVLQGAATNDYAGNSVSSAGDVNGDGLADVLVGAYSASPAGRSAAGAAYIIYGSRSLAGVIDLGSVNATQGVMLQGGAASDAAGISVSSAGDVNGDGLADVLVGAYSASPASKTRAGAAYVIYGSRSLAGVIDLGSVNATQGVVLQGGAASDEAGVSVSSAGDVNGDGLADVLVGAFQASPASRTKAGAAYVIYGSRSLAGVIDLGSVNATQGVVLQGGAAIDFAGASVSSAGDVNGDGRLDILVGAYYASPSGRSRAGAVYVVYGQPPYVVIYDEPSHDNDTNCIDSEVATRDNNVIIPLGFINHLRGDYPRDGIDFIE